MERRLRAIEARAGTTAADDRITAWFTGMCNGSVFLEALQQVARARAVRRAMHEDRYPLSTIIPRDLGREWDQRELADLVERWQAGQSAECFWPAIEAWADEPDVLGWPAEHSYSSRPKATGFTLFMEAMEHLRRRNDEVRSADLVAGWRAQYPTWKRGMSVDELVIWEVEHLLPGPQKQRGAR